MKKRKVHLVQVNHLYGRAAFLPYSVGSLWAYAQTDADIRADYELDGFTYLRRPVVEAVADLPHDLDVFGLSCYIWNSTITHELAKAVKEKTPSCLVVMGGPHVPDRSSRYFVDHPYVDVLVHAEGEEAVASVLRERTEARPDYTKIPGLTVNLDKASVKHAQGNRVNDLDKLPSPYLAGVFDELVKKDYGWLVTTESMRGCPYQCSFCLYGETLIHTDRGQVMISQVTIADKVLTRQGWKKVLKSGVTQYVDWVWVLTVSFSGKQVQLIGSEDHLIYDQFTDEWVRLGEYAEKPRSLFCVHEEESRVELNCSATTVKLHMKRPEPLYNIEVEEVPEFFANGILVHNCDWGSATFTKLRKFNIDRIQGEFEWSARNGIDMLYSADSNWGIFERDVELTERLVKVKEKYGFPKKFRAAYAKNSNDRVFQVSKMLNDAGMSKGTTLSFQSMDDHTLEVIKRKNIRVQDFRGLMDRYRDAGIPTYSEMICGLPGETYDSWADGFDKLLNAAPDCNINCYSAEVLPNAEMGSPEYREKHGIKSVKTPVLFFHASAATDPHQEFYEIVTSTADLSPSDWLKSELYAWAVQALHCMGAIQKLAVYAKYRHRIAYRRFYEGLIDFAESDPTTVLATAYDAAMGSYSRLRRGLEWGFSDPRFGDIIWPVEEGGFLLCATEAARFYNELGPWLAELMPDDHAVDDVLRLQRTILKLPHVLSVPIELGHDVVEYLDSCYRDAPSELVEGPVKYNIVGAEDYGGDLERWSRECVWYNRKGGVFFHKIERL